MFKFKCRFKWGGGPWGRVTREGGTGGGFKFKFKCRFKWGREDHVGGGWQGARDLGEETPHTF
jgi:hypothetical protein